MKSVDVIIIGGGIIGCALARTLAKQGVTTVVLDKGEIGTEASRAAAGMLGPQAEAEKPGPFLDFCLTSRNRFPRLVAELQEETGIDVEYQTDGILYIALEEEDEKTLSRRFDWQKKRGLELEKISGKEARQLEPGINQKVGWALLFPGDHRVDNARLTTALAVAAGRAGARFFSGSPVTRILTQGGRAVGVETNGQRFMGGAVVNAAGAWANMIKGNDPEHLPVRPVRGQMILLASTLPPFRHAMYSLRGYLVPRRDGRILGGSTYEDVGYDKRVTGAGVTKLLSGALEMIPQLRGATFCEAWAGLRPGTPDGLPILGSAPATRALFYATGHYRNGVLLAPITADLLSELILTGVSSIPLDPFSPARFPSV